jgi:hypothetical protein
MIAAGCCNRSTRYNDGFAVALPGHVDFGRYCRHLTQEKGENDMGDTGKRDKGKKEQKKKAQLTPMEKRKLKQAKKK